MRLWRYHARLKVSTEHYLVRTIAYLINMCIGSCVACFPCHNRPSQSHGTSTHDVTLSQTPIGQRCVRRPSNVCVALSV